MCVNERDNTHARLCVCLRIGEFSCHVGLKQSVHGRGKNTAYRVSHDECTLHFYNCSSNNFAALQLAVCSIGSIEIESP